MDLARHIKWIRPLVLPLCLGPLAHLLWEAIHDALGANPIEAITHSTATWTLVGSYDLSPKSREMIQNEVSEELHASTTPTLTQTLRCCAHL